MKKVVKETTRLLRKRSTTSEDLFWDLVRNKKFLGLKFYRQYPLFVIFESKKKFFVADFYCHTEKIVIELDGKIHENQKEYDGLRSELIKQLGIRVIRFNNEEIINRTVETLKKLKECLIKPLSFQERGWGEFGAENTGDEL